MARKTVMDKTPFAVLKKLSHIKIKKGTRLGIMQRESIFPSMAPLTMASNKYSFRAYGFSVTW